MYEILYIYIFGGAMDENSCPSSGDLNENTEENSCDSDNCENCDSSSDDLDVEIIADDKTEEYEEEVTGIKIKYSLTENEVRDYVKFIKRYDNYQKVKKRHVFVQVVLLIVLLSVAVVTGSVYYMLTGLFPVAAIIFMYLVPYMSNSIAVNKMLKENEFTVEIFPDRLEVQTKNGVREIFLNNICESTEHNNMIMIFSPEGHGVVIPLRAIEPELHADVQAIIAAGSNPKYSQYEQINL